MKNKLIKTIIPFISMITINLGNFFIINNHQIYGNGLNPHIGLLFVSGLLLGPYGSIGAVLGYTVSDYIKGYPIETLLFRLIIGFAVSYLSYKLWYTKFNDDDIYPPRLVNSGNLTKFLGIILITGLIYSVSMDGLLNVINPPIIHMIDYIDIKYFLNYINFSVILGIIGIWIARKLNYFHIPKISSKPPHNLFYKCILIIMIILTIIFSVDGYIFKGQKIYTISAFILLLAIVYIYLTKPITSKFVVPDKTTHEKIMDVFLLITLIIIMGDIVYINFTIDILKFGIVQDQTVWELLLSADMILLIFFIPSGIVLNYIEKKLIKPILSFSKIDGFIHEGEKIKTEGLLDVYSPYISEETEIGKLARSYTDLINYNNHYIENINKIESERERIKTELDISKRIQQSNLPTEPLKNEYYHAYGFSEPAKEVGGDFYDYFEIDDENIAIVIGDASGKGVPAALLATTTQTIIRDQLHNKKDPSKVLYFANNHLCRNNSETMFITLWLGIYNKKTNILNFSNAGHNPPIIEENNNFKLLDIDSGIALGILEEYNFITEEIELPSKIIVYTDGITDAINKNETTYGEERLINCLNNNSNEDIINSILNDVNNFVEDNEQFDDMTILILENNYIQKSQ